MSSTIVQSLPTQHPDSTSFTASRSAESGQNEKLHLRGDSRSQVVESISSTSEATSKSCAIADLAELLFSERHMRHIFSSPPLLSMFTTFLNSRRPPSMTVLVYYFDVLKALKAVRYANAISQALKPLRTDLFAIDPPRPVVMQELEDKAETALGYLLEEDLPAYITQIYTTAVLRAMERKLISSSPSSVRRSPGDLIAAFFLTDSSKLDNPIVYASEGFFKLTGHRPETTFGQHLRFLYGAKTKRSSICRIEEAYREVREHCELVLNYRSDGSVYLNLLTVAPLCDSHGKVRYFLGYQIDVNASIPGANELQLLNTLLNHGDKPHEKTLDEHQNNFDELKELSEMLSSSELQTIRRHGGRLHSVRKHVSQPSLSESMYGNFLPHDPVCEVFSTRQDSPAPPKPARGPHRDYLLLRPFPSLRILFASPSLRVPGVLQSPFLSRVGGSRRVLEGLTGMLAAGRAATARIRWATHPEEEARTRYIRCTPLKGRTGRVGVWVVVLMDEAKLAPSEEREQAEDSPTTRSRASKGMNQSGGPERSYSQANPAMKKGRWHAAAPNTTSRVEEWRGTCWREDDDESEDERPSTRRRMSGPSRSWEEGTSFLNIETDDEGRRDGIEIDVDREGGWDFHLTS